MTLQESFSALYYKCVAPSLLQARMQELEYILFGKTSKDEFQISDNGHMTYRNPSGFEHPFLGVPLDEATALAAYAKFSEDANRKILRNFSGKDYKIPALFPPYMKMRSITPIFSKQDASSIDTAKDSRYPQYWELVLVPELAALRMKTGGKQWEELQARAKGSAGTGKSPSLSDYMAVFRPEALAALLKLSEASVVEGESITLQIGKKGKVIGMSYRHLPVLEQTPSDLLVPTDLDVGSLLKQEHVSGAKSLTHTPALPALAGMSFVHKRHAETRLLAPHWLGGGAACGEGVIGGEGESGGERESPPTTNYILLFPIEEGGTKVDILQMIQKTVTPPNRKFIHDKEGYLDYELLQKGDKKDFIFDILLKLYEKLVAEKNTLVITASSNLFVGGGAGSITAFWEETEVIKYKTTEETTLPYVDNVDTGTESYISPRIQNNVVVGVTNDTKTQYKRVLVKPSNGALGATPPKNISLSNLGRFQIAINYQLKSYGLAETFAHEFYSHLWLKLQGLPFAHFEASTEKRIESVLAHEKKILKQVYENYNKK